MTKEENQDKKSKDKINEAKLLLKEEKINLIENDKNENIIEEKKW